MESKHHDTIRTSLTWLELRKLRMRCLVKQNFCCANCNQDVIQFRVKFELHHINGNPKDNRMANLWVLCVDCHKKIHRSRYGW